MLFCYITVETMNETVAALYNVTDFYSGECCWFIPIQPPHVTPALLLPHRTQHTRSPSTPLTNSSSHLSHLSPDSFCVVRLLNILSVYHHRNISFCNKHVVKDSRIADYGIS